MAQTSLTHDALEALLSPFSPEHLGWLKVELELDHARWEPVLSKTALFERLDDILETDWNLVLEVVSPMPAVVVATLSLSGVRRSGIGEGLNLRDAEVLALSSAALTYGIAFDDLSVGSRWERTDWQPSASLRSSEGPSSEGPLSATPPPRATEGSASQNRVDEERDSSGSEYELEDTVPLEVQATVQQAPPLDPERGKAQKHIDDMLEKLKASDGNLHVQGLQIMMKKYKGYGSSLEESRALYLELKDLLKKAKP